MSFTQFLTHGMSQALSRGSVNRFQHSTLETPTSLQLHFHQLDIAVTRKDCWYGKLLINPGRIVREGLAFSASTRFLATSDR